MESIHMIVLGAAGAAVFLADFFLHKRIARRMVERARLDTAKGMEKAREETETWRREARLEARETLEASERNFEKQTRDRNRSLEGRGRRLDDRERNLDRKASLLQEKHKEVEKVQASLEEDRNRLKSHQGDLEKRIEEQSRRLEQIGGMTSVEAKQELMRDLESEAREEVAQTIKRIQEEAREKADEQVRWIFANSLQKVPSHEINDNLTCQVPIPNDEMKGRIIGREGRNIRAIEMNTGVDIIVDDTPGTIVISSFDPLRREMARIAIEKLIEDGRIHPARIEEVTTKVREEIGQRIQEWGETAAYELAVPNLHPKLIRLVGTLKYHGRIGQNLLAHTMEVAHLAEALALELNVNPDTVKRAALLHEIGQVGETVSGTPPLLLSAELAARYSEPEEIVHYLRALGGEVEARKVEAILLQIADEVSLNRPGAQNDKVETHVSRQRRLEDIARSFRGVRAVYALRAGKELRVIVDSGNLSDKEIIWLSKNIASRISADQVCSGHVRVSVIRETRAVDFAL